MLCAMFGIGLGLLEIVEILSQLPYPCLELVGSDSNYIYVFNMVCNK
jgi:hypothetical protein